MCDKEIVVCAAIWVQDHKNKPHGPVKIGFWAENLSN